MLSTILNAFQVAEIRKKLGFTAAMLLIYRLGSHIPVPGVNLTAVNNIQKEFGGGGILSYLNLFSGGEPVQTRAVRAGDHAVHHRLDHPAAAAGGRAVAGKALQGRRSRSGADHPVHPLPDGRAGVRAVDRLRVPVPLAAGESRRIGRHALRRAAHLPDRDLPDDRLRTADVDRRADHPARDRQRDLAADLRLDRLAAADRHPDVVDDPGSGLQGDDAVPRAGGRRRDRVRAGGPAADPRAVRQARDRPAHVRGRSDVSAAAREHGRRDPGDLRRIADGVSRRPSVSS